MFCLINDNTNIGYWFSISQYRIIHIILTKLHSSWMNGSWLLTLGMECLLVFTSSNCSSLIVRKKSTRKLFKKYVSFRLQSRLDVYRCVILIQRAANRIGNGWIMEWSCHKDYLEKLIENSLIDCHGNINLTGWHFCWPQRSKEISNWYFIRVFRIQVFSNPNRWYAHTFRANFQLKTTKILLRSW